MKKNWKTQRIIGYAFGSDVEGMNGTRNFVFPLWNRIEKKSPGSRQTRKRIRETTRDKSWLKSHKFWWNARSRPKLRTRSASGWARRLRSGSSKDDRKISWITYHVYIACGMKKAAGRSKRKGRPRQKAHKGKKPFASSFTFLSSPSPFRYSACLFSIHHSMNIDIYIRTYTCTIWGMQPIPSSRSHPSPRFVFVIIVSPTLYLQFGRLVRSSGYYEMHIASFVLCSKKLKSVLYFYIRASALFALFTIRDSMYMELRKNINIRMGR